MASKNLKQLTEATSFLNNVLLYMVDTVTNENFKIKLANIWNNKPYADIYTATGGTTTITLINTWYNILNGSAFVTNDGILNQFTHDSATGKLTYTGEENIICEVNALLGIVSDTNNDEIQLAITINGTIVTRSIISSKADATFPLNSSTQALVELTNGDEVGVAIQNLTNADEMNIQNLNFRVKAV